MRPTAGSLSSPPACIPLEAGPGRAVLNRVVLDPVPSSQGPVDALLVLSFGGPEGPDEVRPFLENVTRGRGVPPERLDAVAEHYQHFGGVSPINALNRDLIAACGELGAHATCRCTSATATGTRWSRTPSRRWRATGVRRALVFATSAYGGYSACRAVPRGHRAGPQGGRRSEGVEHGSERPSWSSCATSSTTRPSSRQTPTRCAPPATRCRPRSATARGSCSPRTRSRPPPTPPRARPPRAGTATPGRSPRPPGWWRDAARRSPSATSCGSPGPARRRCRGSSPTSSTTSRRCRRRRRRGGRLRRSASSPTTSR